MQLSRMDFIRNVPLERRARVTFRGRAGQQYQDMLDTHHNTDYYLTKRIEQWWVVYEFVIAIQEPHPISRIGRLVDTWTVEEILAREG